MSLRNVLRWSLAFLAVSTFIINATANVCDFSSIGGQLFVTNQTYLDANLGGCTTINGKIIISPNYTGSFIIRNVTNITEPITTQVLAFGDETSLPPDRKFYTLFLTSFQADSVSFMPTSLYLDNVPALKSVSMANLDFIERFYVDSNPALTIDLPQLKSTLSLEISGGFSSMNFDQLARVDGVLSINSGTAAIMGPNGYNKQGRLSNGSHYPPMDINFPSLAIATSLSVWGNISSISMPNLATSIGSPVTDNWVAGPADGVEIVSIGNPLSVSLPRLSKTSQLALLGNFLSLSFPSLLMVNGSYYLDTKLAMNINLTPLQAAVSVHLYGNLTSVNISSLQDLESGLTISSDSYINCAAVISQLHVTNYYVGTNISLPDPTYQTSCVEAPKPLKASPQLPAAEKAGIAVAIGIPGLFLIFWFLYRWWKKNRVVEPVFVFQYDNKNSLGGAGKQGGNAVPGNTLAASRKEPGQGVG